MRAGNLTPDALYLGELASLGLGGGLVRLGTVNIGNTLAAVEGGIGSVVDRVDLQKRGGGVLGALTALVAEVACLYVQSTRMDGLVCGGWICMVLWGGHEILLLDGYPGREYYMTCC